MSSPIKQQISASLLAAGEFTESLIRPIGPMWGFPEYRGRERVTECGGTSSGLAILKRTGFSSDEMAERMSSALLWLVSQQSDGAWQSSGVYCLEVTSIVLCDLDGYEDVDKSFIEAALKYLSSCFKGDHFISSPESLNRAPIFTTCIAIRTLSLYSKVPNPLGLKSWLDSARGSHNVWGATYKSDDPSPVQTAYALDALSKCLGSWVAVRNSYQPQIEWLKRNYKKTNYESELLAIAHGKDKDGQTEYRKLSQGHMCLAICGRVLAALDCHPEAMHIAHQILKQQHLGGWGPRKDYLTLWATNEAIRFLENVVNETIPKTDAATIITSRFIALPKYILWIMLGTLYACIGIAALIYQQLAQQLIIFAAVSAIAFAWKLVKR